MTVRWLPTTIASPSTPPSELPFAGPEGVIAVLPLGLVLRGPEGLFRVEVVFVGGPEPGVKRAVSFVDGQNLYHHAKAAFGHPVPNYDPWALAGAVCQQRGFRNVGVRFYTGVPLVQKDPKWHGFWRRRLLRMRHHGIDTTERPLHYRRVQSPGPGGPKLIEIPQEKGIDVRISLDVVHLAVGGRPRRGDPLFAGSGLRGSRAGNPSDRRATAPLDQDRVRFSRQPYRHQPRGCPPNGLAADGSESL